MMDMLVFVLSITYWGKNGYVSSTYNCRATQTPRKGRTRSWKCNGLWRNCLSGGHPEHAHRCLQSRPRCIAMAPISVQGPCELTPACRENNAYCVVCCFWLSLTLSLTLKKYRKWRPPGHYIESDLRPVLFQDLHGAGRGVQPCKGHPWRLC